MAGQKPAGSQGTATAARLPRIIAPKDREFLPAALEIIETPLSVVSVALIWLICAMFAAALLWSCLGRLEIYAVGQGKIQPVGRSKVVQPLGPGKVLAVFVRDGSEVAEGDLLLELDGSETAADQEKLRLDLESAEAEATRRRWAIETARGVSFAAIPSFGGGISAAVRDREQRALDADLAQLDTSRRTLEGQLAQQLAAQSRLDGSVAERGRLIALSKERVDIRKAAESKGAGSRALIIDALTQYQSELVTQANDEGQLREIGATLQQTASKIAEVNAKFVAEQMQKLVDAERKREQLQQDLGKAQVRHARMQLRAPISGTVQQLAVTTVGQVVGVSQPLMVIVPRNAPLEIETMILNRDIGFVTVGQPAVIKVESFPFTRHGTLDGTVTKVSSDAVDLRDAPNLSDAAAPTKASGLSPSSPTNRPELVFPVTIALPLKSIAIDGRRVSLVPGMTVTVEIQTGSRRVIDYLLSPLREVAAQAAHER
ncbi:HlyD family type I secretion periplasmic adaptor subunit [Rhodopseudomonas sp. HC1]|uniref:HlyD family type I secretion periplasmic adaptor subunit n=1 Tax=Rhodopseudomonas infernalis TaxID=2897386 RepID=UPI001EE91F28|nr:HlyD family type I secretion periplasmic adaptor subunit [Rhodopseudomonas infernalis]MCG6206405.1 HlyD family type I secretion periplasmic adaptor subunit [Rhodopseudomonas infernalis]